jgi:hypothetical protein
MTTNWKGAVGLLDCVCQAGFVLGSTQIRMSTLR